MALEEADNDRQQSDKASQENTVLGVKMYTLRGKLVSVFICMCTFTTMKKNLKNI